MKPTANDLASAVAALYGKPRLDPDLALLKRMLDMAQLQIAGARPLSYAQLLSGCVAAGWRPDERWLAEHHAAAAKALRAPGAADADVLLQLLSALSAPQLAPRAGSDGAYMAARDALLCEVAQRLLLEPAVRTLAAQPDVLMEAVRQVVVQGARPAGQWAQQVMHLTGGMVQQLSTRGLACAAEGLALLRAAPSASLTDALLTQAGKYGTESYDPRHLGLLLGGVHTLQQVASAADAGRQQLQAAEDSKAGALTAEAQEAWGRAHAAFLPQCLDVLSTYTPAQVIMVTGSVVAYVMAQPAGALQAVDAPWLSGLLGALLQCRTSGALPPPSLLVDLLRLGSRVLGGSEDGGIAAMASADTTRSSSTADNGCVASMLLSYVQLSLTDLAAAAAEDVDWPLLLRAALAAGVCPETSVLQKYAAALAERLYGMLNKGTGSKDQLSGAVRTLEEAITSTLQPALPWVPAGGLLPRVLESPALLQACSPRQLALLCTYATQSGLGSQRMWEHVRAEVQARGESLSAARGNAAAAADYFSVCYALEVAGCSMAGSGLANGVRTWLGQLQDLHSSEGPSMAPLQALHVLWVAHRLGDLALAPPGVWAALHAATDSQLQLLLSYQLAQLVELRAAAAAAGLPLPPVVEGYTVRVLGALGARQQAHPGAGAGAAAASDATLLGLASVRALAYLPAEVQGGSVGALLAHSLSFFEADSSTGAATTGGRVSGLSAADAATWAAAVERLQSALGGPPASTLSLRQLRGVVGALAAHAPAATPLAGTKGAGEGAGAGSLGLHETVAVSA